MGFTRKISVHRRHQYKKIPAGGVMGRTSVTYSNQIFNPKSHSRKSMCFVRSLANAAKAALALSLPLIAAACSSNTPPVPSVGLTMSDVARASAANQYGVQSSPRVWNGSGRPPRGTGTRKLGKPYVVAGRTYVPRHDPYYNRVGYASWYGDDFHGRLTANGEVFDMHALTAAHPTLPMPSVVRVTNLENGRTIVVRVNDRGPFVKDRLIDLSRAAASRLGFQRAGVTRVRVKFLGLARLNG